MTPAGPGQSHNPDEEAHMAYVRTIASGHLPVFHIGGANYEAHQPPLYYALCAPVYALTHGMGDATATEAVRVVATLFGGLLVWVTYLCISALFPEEPLLALGTAGFVALLPMNIAQSASVTNDSLTNLVIALGLWKLARLASGASRPADRPRWIKRGALIGLVIGLGIWTKTSTLLFVPVVALVYFGLARTKLVAPNLSGVSCAAALGVSLLIGLPWLLRNQLLYGDPVARHIFQAAFIHTTMTADTMTAIIGSQAGYIGSVEQWTFASFWGGFDSMSVFWGQSPNQHGQAFYVHGGLPLVYGLLAMLGAMSLVGVFSRLRVRPNPLSAPQGLILAAFAALIILTLLSFAGFASVFFQAQGRYLYPALIPLAFFFVWGLFGLFRRPASLPFVTAAIAVGLVLLNLYTLIALLWPRFHS